MVDDAAAAALEAWCFCSAAARGEMLATDVVAACSSMVMLLDGRLRSE